MYKIMEDLKLIRKAHGITGYKLGKMVNKPQSYICMLEKRGNPKISTLIQILDVLGYELRAVKK